MATNLAGFAKRVWNGVFADQPTSVKLRHVRPQPLREDYLPRLRSRESLKKPDRLIDTPANMPPRRERPATKKSNQTIKQRPNAASSVRKSSKRAKTTAKTQGRVIPRRQARIRVYEKDRIYEEDRVPNEVWVKLPVWERRRRLVFWKGN